MHDYLVGILVMVMVLAPCVAALTTKLEDGNSKYDL